MNNTDNENIPDKDTDNFADIPESEPGIKPSEL